MYIAHHFILQEFIPSTLWGFEGDGDFIYVVKKTDSQTMCPLGHYQSASGVMVSHGLENMMYRSAMNERAHYLSF